MRPGIGLSFIQVMALITKPIMTSCQLHLKEPAFSEIWITMSSQENAFENDIYKMASILSWPPCVNTGVQCCPQTMPFQESRTMFLPANQACHAMLGCPFSFNASRPRQNRHQFADHILKCTFLHKCLNCEYNCTEMCPEGPADDKSTLVQVIDWYRIVDYLNDKPLPEPMLTMRSNAIWNH